MSAAFILIGGKLGDLIGRKRAYVLGLLGYAVGAAGDGAGPEPDRSHHLLGAGRRAGRLAAAAVHAVAHPRQLRRSGPDEGLRPGRRRGRDRRRGRATARRLHHDLPVLAGRLHPRGRHHRGRPLRHQTRPRRALHRAPRGRRGGLGPVRRGHGRCRAQHPGVAGGRRIRRSRSWSSASPGWPGWSTGYGAAPGSRSRHCWTPRLFESQHFKLGHLPADAPADRPGRHDDRAADLPADGPRVQRDAGRSDDGPALAEHVRDRPAGGEEGGAAGGRAASSGSASPCSRWDCWC